jgi:c-di-GMP-binding flagellar brake protein YcgR
MFFFKRKGEPSESQKSGIQKRKHKRILYSYPVEMIVGEKRTQRSARTLSAGGLYIAAPFELPLETLIHLRIGTESRYRFIDAYGSVVYNQSGHGMGIKFVRISPEDQKKIQAIIDKSWSQEV